MQSTAKTPDQYIAELPEERKEAIIALRKLLQSNLPEGYKEEMSYGMIGYVVPHSIYPKGYHSTPKLPLPFVNLASQKNYIALYHMGITADKALLKWFTEEYPKHSKARLDMGKGCIRFKKMEHIPYKLIGELVSKMTVKEWINLYEKTYRK
jgi:uncharacterized protein YdhG (YjbR/CyaY superfamily)